MDQSFFGENLRKLRKSLHLNQEDFAKPLGIKGSYISKVETGQSIPAESVLLHLEEKYRINRDWLFTGEGEPFLSGEHPPEGGLYNKDRMEGGPGGEGTLYNKDRDTDLIEMIVRRVVDVPAIGDRDAREDSGLYGRTKFQTVEGVRHAVVTFDPRSHPRKVPEEIIRLVTMAVDVLLSGTHYAESLAANIRSFHDGVETKRKVVDHEKRIRSLEEEKGDDDHKGGCPRGAGDAKEEAM